MVFSSLPFLFFFLPAFLILYHLVPFRAKNPVLLVFSLLFYAWGEPVYVFLMLFSAFVDYLDGVLLERFGNTILKRRIFLFSALFINLSLLAFFKYADFAVRIFNGLTGLHIAAPGIALPIGISFYTFQTVSYSVDVYKKRIPAERHYLKYLTYVSMFPQLIAGPIVRFSTVQEDLNSRRTSGNDLVNGSRRFLTGLMRKVLIANQIGALWDSIRADAGISMVTAWLGLLCFTLQLYFDFSAYSDMAIGLGRIMGFHFPENFIYPLSAVSITDFWHRWHISLSTWFRDYVYIPLGGNREGKAKHLRNMFIVWFLTGLWHGASVNFIIWGLYHGVLLALEKYVWGRGLKRLPAFLQHLYTLAAVVFGFGIFTFDDMDEMGRYFPALIGLAGHPLIGTDVLWYAGNYLPVLAAAVILSFPVYPRVREKVYGSGRAFRNSVLLFGSALMLFGLILTVASLVRDTYNPFLYFRF